MPSGSGTIAEQQGDAVGCEHAARPCSTARRRSNSIAANFIAGDTITVNGQTITFVASGAAGNNQINITDSISTLLAKIDALTGTASRPAIYGGSITLHSGTPPISRSRSSTPPPLPRSASPAP